MSYSRQEYIFWTWSKGRFSYNMFLTHNQIVNLTKFLAFSVCDDPMLDGDNSVFMPTGRGRVGDRGPDDYSPVDVPRNGMVILKSALPAELTNFKIRVDKPCSKGGTLSVIVKYFRGGASEEMVCNLKITAYDLINMVIFKTVCMT